MISLFGGLKSLLKVHRLSIDGTIFRLHYSLTVAILTAFSLLVATRQYAGNPIECVSRGGFSKSLIETFCWIHATFTIPGVNGTGPIFPGFDSSRNSKSSERHYIKYYQWVPFVLFFQAGLFYFPRWLWKAWEGGKIQMLAVDLSLGTGCRNDSDAKQRRKVLLDYLWESRGQHSSWAARYILCEILSMVNVLGQLFLMNTFFEGEFIAYGIRVIAFVDLDPDTRTDPMILLFPRVTKCKFSIYGMTGDFDVLDIMCIMPLNVINEKIFIFLWFWILTLVGLTALNIAFRLLTFTSAWIRVQLLSLKLRIMEKKHLRYIVAVCNFGDWFLIYLLVQNIDPLISNNILMNFSKIAQEQLQDHSP